MSQSQQPLLPSVSGVPAGWASATLESIAARSPNAIVGGPFGSDLVSRDYVDDGVPVVRGQNMAGRWVTGPFVFVSPTKASALEANLARPGDLVFTQRGTLGQVSEVPSQPYARYLISQSQMKVTLDPKIGVPSFYYYFFSSPARQEVIRRSAIQTGVPHINLGILRQFAVKVPPISEQRSIAAALSDVDSLLAKLEQLIAKKRDLKQAAMQQLLTGRIRISGFTGEWQPTRLGDLANLTMGRTPSRRVQAYWGSGYMWASIADMQTKVLSETAEQITEAGASGVPIIPAGTLLMSFKLSIGRLAFAGCDLFTNEAICAFRKLKANASFLYYALQRVDFSQYGKQAVKGYTLNKQSLNAVEVLLPETREQQAIAEILSDLDAEIDALVARCDKTRQLKQGMMQALLTGRIRLT